MPKYLVLPKIGMNMEEGTLVEWLVKPGDKVEKEQMVARAETDKAVQDMFATESGIVYKLLAQPGDTVPCQGKIAILLDEGEEYTESDGDAAAPAPSAPATEQIEQKNVVTAAPKSSASVAGEKRRISPLAKKTARELGVALSDLAPAQPGKRIVKADVLRTVNEKPAQSAAPAAEDGDDGVFVPMTRMRKVIAKHMLDSANNKPRVSLVTTVDCERLCDWRERLKLKQKVTFNELIAKACATALHNSPDMNRVSAEGGYRVMKSINIGMAVDAPAGLMVPVLKNVDRKGALQLSSEFAALVEKARAGSLTLDELSGGTFSISNLGMYGVESFDPIINSPECMILGVGCMKEMPVVVDHVVCVRRCMQIALSFDHTVFDGAAAAKLLKDIKEMLEQPDMMLA